MRKIAFLACVAYCVVSVTGQIIAREINVSGTTYVIDRKKNIEELISILGKYSSLQKGDQNKENYAWTNGNKAYYEKGELVLLIIRDPKTSFNGLLIGDSLKKAIEVFGMHDPKNETVQEGMYKDLYWSTVKIRMDVDRKTETIKAIFLNM